MWITWNSTPIKKINLMLFVTYDVDSSDTVSLDLIGGHGVDNQDLFGIYPDFDDGTENVISYPT